VLYIYIGLIDMHFGYPINSLEPSYLAEVPDGPQLYIFKYPPVPTKAAQIHISE
jgi:hypothetical protein